MIRFLPMLAVPLLLPACRSAPNGDENRVVLRIDVVEPTVAAGTSAEVQIQNLSDRTIGFNLCPKVVEREDRNAWTPLPETSPEACTLELYVLAAGETVVQTIEIPSGLEIEVHDRMQELYPDPVVVRLSHRSRHKPGPLRRARRSVGRALVAIGTQVAGTEPASWTGGQQAA